MERGNINTATRALILLHGRGGTSSDILELAHYFVADDSFYIIAPQAPNNTWYPYSFIEEEAKNEPALSNSINIIENVISDVSQYIPKMHMYIMGFSQGACLALEVTARHATTYGGIVAFSGGLIGKTLDPNKYSGNFNETKVFIGVSEHDPHIPASRAEESKVLINKLGAEVTLDIYPGMAHMVRESEIAWVKTNIMPSSS